MFDSLNKTLQKRSTFKNQGVKIPPMPLIIAKIVNNLMNFASI